MRRPSHLALAAGLALLVLATAGTAHGEPEVRDLPFAQFFQQPIGPRGLQPTAALQAADGQRVRLVGFMVRQEQAQPGRFLFAPRPVTMSEHADGEADDLPPATVTVLLEAGRAGHVVPHRPGRLALSGRLSVGRAEDGDGRVSWVRLHLDADAVTDGGPAASSGSFTVPTSSTSAAAALADGASKP